ncbi:hypothetical protein M8J75_007827 [Diaphorina citri]|nr:hypothetical protein M8J75_007827 [Diaphorina citri]
MSRHGRQEVNLDPSDQVKVTLLIEPVRQQIKITGEQNKRREKREKLEQQLKSIQAKCNTIVAQNQTFTDEKRMILERVKQLKRRSQEKSHTIEKLEAEMRETLVDRMKLEEINVSLVNKYHQLETRLENNIKSLQDELSNKDTLISHLHRELQEQKLLNKHLNQQVAQLNKQVTLNQHLSQKVAQLTNEVTENKYLNQQVAQLNDQVALNQHLSQQVAQLQSQLNATHQRPSSATSHQSQSRNHQISHRTHQSQNRNHGESEIRKENMTHQSESRLHGGQTHQSQKRNYESEIRTHELQHGLHQLQPLGESAGLNHHSHPSVRPKELAYLKVANNTVSSDEKELHYPKVGLGYPQARNTSSPTQRELKYPKVKHEYPKHNKSVRDTASPGHQMTSPKERHIYPPHPHTRVMTSPTNRQPVYPSSRHDSPKRQTVYLASMDVGQFNQPGYRPTAGDGVNTRHRKYVSPKSRNDGSSDQKEQTKYRNIACTTTRALYGQSTRDRPRSINREEAGPTTRATISPSTRPRLRSTSREEAGPITRTLARPSTRDRHVPSRADLVFGHVTSTPQVKPVLNPQFDDIVADLFFP